MAMISIRVSEAEKEWLNHMAEFYGTSLSDLVKTYSMEQLEDKYDVLMAESAYKHYQESGKETVSMQEVIDEFGGFQK